MPDIAISAKLSLALDYVLTTNQANSRNSRGTSAACRISATRLTLSSERQWPTANRVTKGNLNARDAVAFTNPFTGPSYSVNGCRRYDLQFATPIGAAGVLTCLVVFGNRGTADFAEAVRLSRMQSTTSIPITN
jgi:hypothetical protein